MSDGAEVANLSYLLIKLFSANVITYPIWLLYLVCYCLSRISRCNEKNRCVFVDYTKLVRSGLFFFFGTTQWDAASVSICLLYPTVSCATDWLSLKAIMFFNFFWSQITSSGNMDCNESTIIRIGICIIERLHYKSR